MKVNNLSKISPKFAGVYYAPVLNHTKNFATKPNPQIFDKSFKILGLVTSALSLATIAMNKKEELPTWEEYKKQLKKMQGNYGRERFSDYCLDEIEHAYKNNPELTLKLIGLKQKDKWFISFGEDVLSIVKQYEKHPEFSDYLLNQIENEGNSLISFLKTDSTNQEMLMRLFNYRDVSGMHLFTGISADLIIDFYQKEPEFCERILGTKNPDGKYSWANSEIDKLIMSYKNYPQITLKLMDLEKDNGDKFESSNIKALAIMEDCDRDFYIKVLKCSRLTFYSAIGLYNSGFSKDLISDLLDAKDFYGKYCVDNLTVLSISLLNQEQIKDYKEFFLQSIPDSYAQSFVKRYEIDKIKVLLDLGVPLQELDYILQDNEKYEKVVTEILNNPGEMREFFNSDSYFEKIKQNSAGKYQFELIKIFEKGKMPYAIKEQLFNSDLTVEDFLNSLKKISKSCFKLAYETPNQYLNDINIEYSTLIDGHYPKLSKEELKNERKEVVRFFVGNIEAISRILKYIDNDTFNHLMDKRFDLFKVDLEKLNSVSNEKLEILSKLLNCKSIKTGEKLSPKEKLQICQIVSIFNKTGINFYVLEKAAQKGELDTKEFKKIIEEEVLKAAGINILDNKINGSNKLNEEYAYLTLKPTEVGAIQQKEKRKVVKQIYSQIDAWREDEEILEKEILALEQELKKFKFEDVNNKIYKLKKQSIQILRNIKDYTDKEIFENQWKIFEAATNMYTGEKDLYTTIRISVLNDFKKYIMDSNNKFGKINERTEKEFLKFGLDYKKWLNPENPVMKFNLLGKELTLAPWERNPLEDLFIGNKTTCCTAIGGTNGDAVSAYLLGTCWSVVELKTENGDTVGMSRVFWADVDDRPALIMDNIELNNNFNKSLLPSQKKEVRDNIFKYMREYAKEVSGKNDVKVYFCSQDTHVPVDDLIKIDKKIGFIGKSPTPIVYVNAADCSWIAPSELKNKEYRWYIIQ